jgi:hypothetical protein
MKLYTGGSLNYLLFQLIPIWKELARVGLTGGKGS